MFFALLFERKSSRFYFCSSPVASRWLSPVRVSQLALLSHLPQATVDVFLVQLEIFKGFTVWLDRRVKQRHGTWLHLDSFRWFIGALVLKALSIFRLVLRFT